MRGFTNMGLRPGQDNFMFPSMCVWKQKGAKKTQVKIWMAITFPKMTACLAVDIKINQISGVVDCMLDNNNNNNNEIAHIKFDNLKFRYIDFHGNDHVLLGWSVQTLFMYCAS